MRISSVFGPPTSQSSIQAGGPQQRAVDSSESLTKVEAARAGKRTEDVCVCQTPKRRMLHDQQCVEDGIAHAQRSASGESTHAKLSIVGWIPTPWTTGTPSATTSALARPRPSPLRLSPRRPCSAVSRSSLLDFHVVHVTSVADAPAGTRCDALDVARDRACFQWPLHRVTPRPEDACIVTRFTLAALRDWRC